MPWTCTGCSALVPGDDLRSCPACGEQKTSWTAVVEQTRHLVVPSRRRFEVLRGDSTVPGPAGAAALDGVAWTVTDHAPALPVAMARALARSGRWPAPADLLVVRQYPEPGAASEVEVTPLSEAVASAPARLAAPTSAPWDVPLVLVFGAGAADVAFDGLAVVDVSDATAVGHAPAVEVRALGKAARVLPVQPRRGIVRVRLTGLLFETDKAFLLPKAVPGVRGLKRAHDRDPSQHVLVVGHADTKGQATYNLRLSEERAASIAAYLRDDVDTWTAWYTAAQPSKRWGTREDQHMLSRLPDGEPPFFAGPVNGVPGPTTTAAVKAFQRRTNETRGASLKEDGIAGPATREELVRAYLTLDHTTLPAGATLVTHGCGEFHPAEATGDGVALEANRRVEVFLFPASTGVAPPAQPECPAPGCDEYARWLGQTIETIDLTEGLATLDVRVKDQDGAPVPGAAVSIEGPGRDEGKTGPDGALRLEDELPGEYVVRVSCPGHDPASLDVRLPASVDVVLRRFPPGVARVIPGGVFLGDTACPGPGIVEHVRWVQREADITSRTRLRVFAHARAFGDDARDKALSDRRGQALVALLQRDRAALDAIALAEGWGLRCYQALLRGLGCDPGAFDGVDGPRTRDAVRGFQRDYAAGVFHAGSGLSPAVPGVAVDGVLSAQTKAAVRDAWVVLASSGGAPLPASSFEGEGASGCAGWNPHAEDDAQGRVEVVLFLEPPATFPCARGDAAACQVDRADPPRCRFYRETVDEDERRRRAPLVDLSWTREADGSVTLSAVTSLPDGAPARFVVHRCDGPPPSPAPTSAEGWPRPALGPVLGEAQGQVQAGVASARLALPPPSSEGAFELFDWTTWLVEQADGEAGTAMRPPVFVVEVGPHWAVSRPPGVGLERLRFTAAGSVRGLAVLGDGRLVPFESVDGLVRAHGHEVVAVHLEGHRVGGVEAP